MNTPKWLSRLPWTSRSIDHAAPARTRPHPSEDCTDVLASFPEACRIAASLREYPADWAWRLKGYELEHAPTGFVMWVANEGYGLAEVSSGHKAKFNPGEQSIIWPAVQTWLLAHKVGFTGRLPKVKIWRHQGLWRCMSQQHPWVGAGDTPEKAYRSWSRAVSVEARTDQRPGEILHVWSAAQ